MAYIEPRRTKKTKSTPRPRPAHRVSFVLVLSRVRNTRETYHYVSRYDKSRGTQFQLRTSLPIPFHCQPDLHPPSHKRAHKHRSTHIDQMRDQPRIVITSYTLHQPDQERKRREHEVDRPLVRDLAVVPGFVVFEADGVGAADEPDVAEREH